MAKAPLMAAAEVYFDPQANYSGLTGAWRARLKDNHAIHDCAEGPAAVMRKLVVTAASHGYPLSAADYEITGRTP
jgi:hypothetical protein